MAAAVGGGNERVGAGAGNFYWNVNSGPDSVGPSDTNTQTHRFELLETGPNR